MRLSPLDIAIISYYLHRNNISIIIGRSHTIPSNMKHK